MACTKETVKSLGLNRWYDSGRDGTEPSVDIILVQGLGAHPYYTWTGRQQDAEAASRRRDRWIRVLTPQRSRSHSPSVDATTSVPEHDFFWPRDLLPVSLPPCTVSTYSYPSNWNSRNIKTDLRTCGEQFLNILHNDRQDKASRPIVLVGHSLGGLVIQQALVIASHGDTFQRVRESVRGVLFLGTPMQGCDVASFGEWAQRAVGNDQPLLRLLKSGSDDLLSLIRDFWSGYGRLPVVCFYEANQSNLGGLKTVNVQSATLVDKRRIYLLTDHSGLNKFRGADDENYQLFLPALQEVINSAIAKAPTGSCSLSLCSNAYQYRKGPATTKTRWMVPFARDPGFVERGKLMNDIDKMLLDTQNNPRVALWGLGGVGKSQIAIEYAYQRRERLPQVSIFWIHASNTARFRQSYQVIANELQLAGLVDPKVDQLDLVYQWLLSEESGDWLLIVDNADDINFVRHNHGGRDEDMHEFSISQYLPQRQGGSVLITSRNRHSASILASSPEHVIEILPMTDAEAKLLIDIRLPRCSDNDDASRQALARELEYIPLAITQAAAYITKSPRMSIIKYLHLFSSTEAAQVLMLTTEGGDLRRDPEVPDSVIRTWEISLTQIELQNPLSTDLLCFMALIDRQGIPEFLLRQDHTEFEFEEAIDMLLGFAFVTVEHDEATFSMHRLIQVATRAWLRTRQEMDRYQNMVLIALNENYPGQGFKYWGVCQILEPHANVALQTEYGSDNLDLVLANLLYKRAMYHNDQGKHVQAEHFAHSSWVKETRILGEEHENTLLSMDVLAASYSHQGRLNDAMKMLERVVKSRKNSLGEEHPCLLRALNNLATVYMDLGQYDDAAGILERVVRSEDKLFGTNDMITLSSWNNIGMVYYHQGRYQDAAEIFERIVRLGDKSLIEDHPSILKHLNNLGMVYCHQERYGEAAEILERVVKSQKELFGEENPDVLTTMTNLAHSYLGQGRHEEAERIFQRNLELGRKVLGTEHPDTARSLNNLTCAYAAQRRFGEAMKIQEEAVDLAKKVLGTEHPITLIYISNLERIHSEQRSHEDNMETQEGSGDEAPPAS